MRLFRTLLAIAIVTTCHHARAVDIELSHATLSDVHVTAPGYDLGTIKITEHGHVASLDLVGMASAMSLEQTGPEYAYAWNALHMLATPDDGYAVRSLRIRAELAVTATVPSHDHMAEYSFYLASPGLLGVSVGTAVDGQVEDWTMQTTDLPWFEPGAPFNIYVNTGLEMPWYPSFPVPAGTTTISFTSIRLDIETVPVAQIPEPGTWAMLLAGLAGVGIAARRRPA